MNISLICHVELVAVDKRPRPGRLLECDSIVTIGQRLQVECLTTSDAIAAAASACATVRSCDDDDVLKERLL